MLSSIPGRVVTPVQPAATKPPVAPVPVTPPAATPYFQDAMEYGRRSLVNLSGFGTAPPAAVPTRVHPEPPESGGTTSVGPKLLHLDTGWTPQGQGYDRKRGEVLTTYYHDGRGVLLSVQDKNSGDEALKVRLGGRGPDHPAGPPKHGGGVSTDGKFVYVSDTEHIYVYKREAIDKAAREGTEARAFQVMNVPQPKNLEDPEPGISYRSAGSYMAVKGRHAYIGAYSDDGDYQVGAVWRYRIGEDGSIIKGSRQGPIRAPDQSQGIAVVNGALLFTTGSHKLYYQPFEADKDSFTADIKDREEIGNGLIEPFAQGVNIIDGELWVTYESGSGKVRSEHDYDGKAQRHIQRIPLEKLDLDAVGITPEQLRAERKLGTSSRMRLRHFTRCSAWRHSGNSSGKAPYRPSEARA